MTARIIMLNGPSSVGKTTLVADLRPLLPDTFCYYAAYGLGISMRGWSDELLAGDPVALGCRRCSLIAEFSGIDPRSIWQWGFIERVGTGLLLRQIGLPERAQDVLTVADTWAAVDPPWRSRP